MTSAACVHVVALGACTPIGRDAWSSAAAARAAVTGFARHPYMVDTAGEPMHVAFAPWLDINMNGADRLEALLLPAIDEALAPLLAHPGAAPRVALALGLPAARPGVPADLKSELARRVGARYAGRFTARAVFASGHAAGLLALDAAARKLARGELDACVVAGVDSYIDPDTLEWLEQCDQFHGAGKLNNAWGFVPGEGAGAVLLVHPDTLAGLGNAPSLARLLGCGCAFEPRGIKTQSVCIGEGLTAALRTTLQALPAGTRVSDVYCDMNGEPYRADEYGFAGLRMGDAFETLSDFVAPADCWGDVAAASGPLHLLLAVAAGVKGYSRGRTALTWASSESGERAAALLALPPVEN